ncbi:Cell division control protein 7 [Tilletia horrida]|uniref:non-specific serine/threonine protein kinase n=1 Tax=Tilletia horrida TaxID=155126 RepID=A0AAN6JSH2_9BASI|nr:Cell division control protein 7 [Tilletia horrida]KAK0568126.1 Cell division control protein 7 [Tilletia horrida]
MQQMAAQVMDPHYRLGSSSGSSSHPTSILPLDHLHHSSSLERRNGVVEDASLREGKRKATDDHDFLDGHADEGNEDQVEEDRRSYTSSDDAEGSEDEEWLAYQQSLASSQQTATTTEEQQATLPPPLATPSSPFSQPAHTSHTQSHTSTLDQQHRPSISSSPEAQTAGRSGHQSRTPEDDDDDGVFSEEILSSSEKSSEDESESELTEQETSDIEDEEDGEEEPEEDLENEDSDEEDDTPLALQIPRDSTEIAPDQALTMTPSISQTVREVEEGAPDSRQGLVAEHVPTLQFQRCTEDLENDSDLEIEGGPAADIAEYEDDAQEEEQSFEDSDEELEDQDLGPDGISSIAVEAHLLNAAIPTLKDRYKIVGKLGEGTFSTVYKARPLRRSPPERSSELVNPYAKALGGQWYNPAQRKQPDSSGPSYRRGFGEGNAYVALKRIYVSSSPQRIVNELNILVELRNRKNISHLIDIFREREQIIAVMEYTEHADFRDFYRILPIGDIRCYFRCLFAALADVHQANVIHRDVKPANFLYNPTTGHGVLCDFGLAERFNPSDWRGKCHHTCPDERNMHGRNVVNTTVSSTVLPEIKKIHRLTDTKDSMTAADTSSSTSTPRIGTSTCSHAPMAPPAEDLDDAQWPKQAERVGYPTVDNRHPVRANRAGTRGFRAPEVLLKCQDQTVAVDIWSAGVILLCFLTKRFPLFNADDDVIALLEMAVIVGRKDMSACAMIHNRTFKTDIPDVTEDGMSIKDFVRKMNPLPQQEMESELSDIDEAIRTRKEDKAFQPGMKRPLMETTAPKQDSAIDSDDEEITRLERRKAQIMSKIQAWDDAIALATRCLNVFHTKRWSAARILEKDPFFNKRATAGEDLTDDENEFYAVDEAADEPSSKKARRTLI